jgi:hypothetical protein
MNVNDINQEVFKLACEVHGLEEGDTRALGTYEMIMNFLRDKGYLA